MTVGRMNWTMDGENGQFKRSLNVLCNATRLGK
jgi:hypothetical protein